MRTVSIGLALAVVTSTQLLVPPSFAYADTSAPMTAPASATRPSGRAKATTGWVVLGIGGAVLVGGIVLDVLAAGKNTVSGSGGSGDMGTTHDAKIEPPLGRYDDDRSRRPCRNLRRLAHPRGQPARGLTAGADAARHGRFRSQGGPSVTCKRSRLRHADRERPLLGERSQAKQPSPIQHLDAPVGSAKLHCATPAMGISADLQCNRAGECHPHVRRKPIVHA